jgi:hypothetical protein
MRHEGRQTLNQTLSAVAALLFFAIAGEATAVTVNENGTVDEYEWHHFGPFETDIDGIAADMTGTGDADLYIREGAQPTTGTFDCDSDGYYTTETCSVSGEGSYYVSVYGNDWLGSDYDLTISYSDPGSEPPPPLGLEVLFVARDRAAEDEIHNRLETLGFSVTRMSEADFSSTMNLSTYSLVVLTEYASGLWGADIDHIENSGLPVLIVSWWDHAYAQAFGLIDPWLDCEDTWAFYPCESWGVDDVWMTTTPHDVVNGMADPMVALSPSTTVYDVDDDNLEDGVAPLVYSNSYRNRVVAAVDENRLYAFTGLNETTKYTDSAWELFDSMVLYLAPIDHPLPPPSVQTLFVANGWDTAEDDIEDHLAEGTNAFDVVRMTDSELSGTTDLSPYELIVLTGYAPGISADGLSNIVSSGVPVLIIEDGDFSYSQALGLTTSSAGAYSSVSEVETDDETPSNLVKRLGSQVLVQQPFGDVTGISESELTEGVKPLFYSNLVYGEVAVFVDYGRKVSVTGVFDTNKYTADSWAMLDMLIRETAEMDVRRDSLEETVQAYIDSRIPNFLETAKIERIRDPENWTFDAVVDELWNMTVEWRLYDHWDYTYITAAEIFGIFPVVLPWADEHYNHQLRPHGDQAPCPGCLPTAWAGEEHWFLGETPSSYQSRILDEINGKTPDWLSLPPKWGKYHDGTDLGVSVEFHGTTYYYMGDTWDADHHHMMNPQEASWSRINCEPGAKCNDMVLYSRDPNPTTGIDAEPFVENDGIKDGFWGFRIKQVHYRDGNGDLAPDLVGFHGGVEAPFNTPTGAIQMSWPVEAYRITSTGLRMPATLNLPMVVVWYATAAAPQFNDWELDSTDPKTRPTSWVACSMDGKHFYSCYKDGAGNAVPFSKDLFVKQNNVIIDNEPARFLQVSPIRLTEDDFAWICSEDPSSAMCDFYGNDRNGLLLYATGRPYRYGGLFLGYIPYDDLGKLGANGKPIVHYWTGSGWSHDETDAVSLFHTGEPPYDTCTNPQDVSTCDVQPTNVNKDHLFGEISARLIPGDDDRKVFLLANPSGEEPGLNAWRFSIKTPWMSDHPVPHEMETWGYGPYIIDRYSDHSWTAGSGQEGPQFYHLISTWGAGPYGVYSGEEIIPWYPPPPVV